MARARNIKPAFFDNDLLADIEPLGRLLFIGLWTIADYKGDLIYREKRIKAQLLPYDNCDIKEIMINLDKYGFIRFYSDGESIYLNIANFSKHQNPHKNERQKGSDIPEYSEVMAQAVDLNTLTINRDKNGTVPDNNETNRADSLFPITDSLSLIPETFSDEKPKPAKASTDAMKIFEHWKVVMGKSNNSLLNGKRTKAINARLKEGYTVDQIKMAITGCSMTPHNMGQNDNGKRYDDLELICRDGVQVERFANNINNVAKKDINSIGTDFSAPDDWG